MNSDSNNDRWLFNVDGQPFFPLGGQVHNSSAYNAGELERGWKALKAIKANTAEIPVYWEQVEPEPGKFDFSAVDDVLAGAQRNGLKVILLWFGTWKNGMMKYVPEWVKDDTQRFRRVIAPSGLAIAVLSPHCQDTWEADRHAFCALMTHLRETDNTARTVIAVQVENEPGILGSDRDYSVEAETLFRQPIPSGVIAALRSTQEGNIAHVIPDNTHAATWTDLYGTGAGEFFSAWYIARYIDGIAEAGKQIYDIPTYVNVWPQEARWRIAGLTYPAGGATTNVLNVWKAATPHIDVIALDTYILNTADYRAVCNVYNRSDNPLFIPESARHPANALNMFYAIGSHNAIGYAVFGVETLVNAAGDIFPAMQPLADSFTCIRAVLPLLIKYHGTGQIKALVEEEYRTEQYLDLGLYIGLVLFRNADSTMVGTDYHHVNLATVDRGRGLVIQVSDQEFYVVGAGLRILFKAKGTPESLLASPSASDYLLVRLANYRRVEEGHFDSDGTWQVDRIRNGDETDHGIWVQPDIGVVRVLLGD